MSDAIEWLRNLRAQIPQIVSSSFRESSGEIKSETEALLHNLAEERVYNAYATKSMRRYDLGEISPKVTANDEEVRISFKGVRVPLQHPYKGVNTIKIVEEGNPSFKQPFPRPYIDDDLIKDTAVGIIDRLIDEKIEALM